MILYHSSCTDGFTAAWAAYKGTGDDEILPVMHGKAPPDVTGKQVVMVDFTYPKGVLEAMSKLATSILVIDHHKTTVEDLASGDRPWWVNGNPTQYLPANVFVHLDMDRSGAGMTWDYFHGKGTRPRLIDYVEDRDLWRFKLPFSKEISAFIHSVDYVVGDGLAVWDSLSAKLDDSDQFRTCKEIGRTLLAAEAKSLHRHVQWAYETELGGYRVKAVNATVLNSEIAASLATPTPNDPRAFGVAWSMTEDGRYRYSLRVSTPRSEKSIDVTEVAKLFGGGGHANASGFSSDYLVCPKLGTTRTTDIGPPGTTVI